MSRACRRIAPWRHLHGPVECEMVPGSVAGALQQDWSRTAHVAERPTGVSVLRKAVAGLR